MIKNLNPDQLIAELAATVRELSPDISSYFILTDNNTAKYCLPVIHDNIDFKFIHIVVEPDEINKDFKSCLGVWKQLIESGADRNSLLINLGGGQVTDLGGFAASVYMRGIRFINIPTSLLGMVDASVGGKTGINLDSFKNIIGVFSNPQAILVCPFFLNTLPAKEMKNGFAEILKHALIASPEFWNELILFLNELNLESISDDFNKRIPAIIDKAVKIKLEIVNRDPFEKDERKFLNFGHTVGHALETYSLKNHKTPISHGEAVATGMICESFLSVKMCALNVERLTQISDYIKKLFPVAPISQNAFADLMRYIKSDKKSDAGTISYPLLKDIGKPVLTKGISEELLFESFNYYNNL